jgi:DUF4097 and DUF4098 domain-containing protein YvlB
MSILRAITCYAASSVILFGSSSAASVPGAEAQTPAPAPAPSPSPGAGNKLTVPFSDPARPGTVRVSLTNGGIRVRGYQGQTVIVETSTQDDDDKQSKADQGLRRIRNTASGIVIEEERNEIRISSEMPNRTVQLDIQVPVRTSLVLSATNDGDIVVDGVDGELELNNTNGAVTATKVSGTVIAHALNDDVKVTMTRVGSKPMSFTSLNGDIDVVLPADIKANVRMQTGNGEVYSDFAIDMQAPSVQQSTESPRGQGGKYRIKVDQVMVGRINGGGPDITFKTFNGDIRIRKGS